VESKILNVKFKEEADDFEKQIDFLLSNKRLSSGEVTIPIPKSMLYTHFEILKPRYIEAGWKDLKWESFYDQGDQLNYSKITFKE
jgi:hypothetical protein